MEQEPLRIAVLDDQPSFCEGIRSWLSDWPHGEVVLTAGNGLEYEEACKASGPIHIALVDLNMPKRDGYETMLWMRQHQPETRPVAMTGDPASDVIRRCLRLGARGIITKYVRRRELEITLEHVQHMGFCHNEIVHRELVEGGQRRAQNEHVLNSLTRKQREFLKHLADLDAPSYQQIAERMGRSLNTIHKHRAHLFEKFGVSNRQGLYRAAMDWKLAN